MLIKSWQITDVGKKRDHNEDSFLVNSDLHLFLVADGMGGHNAGERASQISVETIERELIKRLPQISPQESGTQMMFISDDPILEILSASVQAASGAILDEIKLDHSLSGMGTTLSGLLLIDQHAYFMHVGDSRIYRLRGNDFEQISVDHSLVQEQVDAGLITQDEANNSKYKNIITRSVGFERSTLPDTGKLSCAPDDLFLICSDGLSNMLSSDEIQEILSKKDPDIALEFFVNLANSRGGDDNITALIVRIENETD